MLAKALSKSRPQTSPTFSPVKKFTTTLCFSKKISVLSGKGDGVTRFDSSEDFAESCHVKFPVCWSGSAGLVQIRILTDFLFWWASRSECRIIVDFIQKLAKFNCWQLNFFTCVHNRQNDLLSKLFLKICRLCYQQQIGPLKILKFLKSI